MYYLDSMYEKVTQVTLPDATATKDIITNEPKLHSLKVFEKRPGEMTQSKFLYCFV